MAGSADRKKRNKMAETLIPAEPAQVDGRAWRLRFLAWIEEAPARARVFSAWRETLRKAHGGGSGG